MGVKPFPRMGCEQFSHAVALELRGPSSWGMWGAHGGLGACGAHGGGHGTGPLLPLQAWWHDLSPACLLHGMWRGLVASPLCL